MTINYEKFRTKDISAHNKSIFLIDWNCEGSYIGSLSGDKTIKVCQLEPSGSAHSIHTVSISSSTSQICWHPTDPNRFAIAGDEKAVELWDVRASKSHSKISSIGNTLNMDWSPCGNFICVGTKTDNLAVLDLKQNCQHKKKKFYYELNEFKWTANSDHILAATGGDGVGAIDIISFQNNELQLVDSITAHSSNCLGLKIDSQFNKMAVSSLDCLVSLWDLDDLICYQSFPMDSEIRDISFSPDGSHIAAISEDPIILISDASSGRGISKISFRYKVGCVRWNPKQNIIAAAFDDRSQFPQYLKFISFTS